jgi:hypothetical protein
MKEGFCLEEEKGSPKMISWKRGVSGVVVERIICLILHCILILRISIISCLQRELLLSRR